MFGAAAALRTVAAAAAVEEVRGGCWSCGGKDAAELGI